MDSSFVPLEGGEVHGFRTLADLDIPKLWEVASTRWLRPNEIHAILTNYGHFTIQPQPVEYPTNGSIVLFDRKVLRNFRRDGYNWKKKKDRKTVQEAHEKLKIGNEDKLHVYYARGEDDPNFCRRCYWLLDKKLEHVVLVHYRQTLEQDNAAQNATVPVEYKEVWDIERNLYDSFPSTPVNSTSGSGQSKFSGSAVVSEEINSREDHAICTGSGMFLLKAHTRLQINELSQHEINNLGWADLALASEYIEPCMGREDGALVSGDAMQCKLGSSIHDQSRPVYLDNSADHGVPSVSPNAEILKLKPMIVGKELDDDSYNCRRNRFVQWDNLKDESLGTLDIPLISDDIRSNSSMAMVHSSVHQQIFTINDVCPEWGYSTEETKVVVMGNFSESHKHLEGSSIYCILGDQCVGTQVIQPGVYRCTALPQIPGNVGLFLTLDGHTPISQVAPFDYRRAPMMQSSVAVVSSTGGKEKAKPEDLMTRRRLARLLFATRATKEAKRFARLTSPSLENEWVELDFKNKLQELLMEEIARGCRTNSRDSEGQGVIHLCAILNYTWAASLFSSSGISLDFRDTYGWTALHWAAYLGRVEMVAALLSAGANPSLVADPSPENPGGLTPADLASEGGHEGLSAYLAEKGLSAHFEAMALSGNAPPPGPSHMNSEEGLFSGTPVLTDQEVCLKESLAAYRNAADAAVRIQAAFRERSLKLQTEAVLPDKSEAEASRIVAALRIQHAYRGHCGRRLMKAAARIQSHFRTWRDRKGYINMRHHTIRIQAVFRGHQARRQYRQIVWSVGVLEKAVLRWRLKRKGLRGMQVESMELCSVNTVEAGEEDFFVISRRQAEERVQRSVVCVQAMFRSYRAQQEYRRMKSAHEQAKGGMHF